MPTSTLSRLRVHRDALKQQADELNLQMSESKATRQALGNECKTVQLHLSTCIAFNDVEGVQAARTQHAEIESQLATLEESMQAMNTRMQMLQREHAMTSAEMNRTESEAAHTANRIKALRHDLRHAKNRPAPELSSPAYASMVTSIQGDLKVSEKKYVGLTGEVLPHDEAA